MRRFFAGLTVGFFISIPWLALMYLGQGVFGFTHIPFKLFEFITWSLPGELVTISIETLIRFVTFTALGQTSAIGKQIEISIAYLLVFVILCGSAGLYAVSIDKLKTHWLIRGAVIGFCFACVIILLSTWNGRGARIDYGDILWLVGMCFAWGLGLAWGVDRYWASISNDQDMERKRFLGGIALVSLALTAAAVGIGRWYERGTGEAEATLRTLTPEPIKPSPTLPPSSSGFTAVPGTRPEITPIEDFYRVDINLLPPGDEEFLENSDPLVLRLLQQGGETDLPADSYILAVDGLVETPLALSLDDIKSFPVVEQYATLTCISNPIGGDLIGTTLFQGARLKDILAAAQILPGVIDIKFTAVDGYTESLPIEVALDPETLLCYNMGEEPLTRPHGSPLRVYTPGRYGIKNPKWIIKIEALDQDYKGFWQQRGWTESGLIKTTSVIDTAQVSEGGQTLIGGIAFAGARGIQSVELQVDNGEWKQAEIDRPLSHLTWVLWRAAVSLLPGEHKITVRTTDGEGNLQTDRKSPTQPDGATGQHSIDISV